MSVAPVAPAKSAPSPPISLRSTSAAASPNVTAASAVGKAAIAHQLNEEERWRLFMAPSIQNPVHWQTPPPPPPRSSNSCNDYCKIIHFCSMIVILLSLILSSFY